MARIPDEVIERLKGEVSVQRLAEARGVIFSKHGADLIGCCCLDEGDDEHIALAQVVDDAPGVG